MPDPDNQLRWLNTCCPDWEGGFSMNPCCPVSVSACVSLSKVGTLCGFSEYVYSGATPPVEASVPPKKYLTETIFNSDFFNYKFSSGECEGQTSRSGGASWSKVDVYGTNPCSFTSGTVTPATRSTDYYSCEDGSSTLSYTATTTNIATKPSDSYTVSNTLREDIYNEPGQDRVIIRRSTLSSEDTESAALARVDDWTQGSSCVSSFDRNKPSFTFSKTRVKHEAVVTGLVIGFCYEGVIPIEQALVKYDEYGSRLPHQPEDWLPFSLTAIDAFKAEQVFQTFGLGTLNVSDDDFINASFSLDPYDYPSYFPVDPETGILIDPDALVLTPFSDLPESKVYDYRVLPAVMRRVECEEE